MMQLTRPPYMADFPVAFAERNGRLFNHSDFTPDIMLKPESEKKVFFANGTDQQIEFETDNSNKL